MSDDAQSSFGPIKYALTSAALGALGTGVTTGVTGQFESAATAEDAVVNPQSTASAGNPTVVSEALLEARIEAVEARTETKFAQLMGKLDLISERIGGIASDVSDVKGDLKTLDSKTNNTRIIIVTTVIGASLTIVGLTYGIIGYGHQVADTISAAFAAGQSVTNDQPETSNPAK